MRKNQQVQFFQCLLGNIFFWSIFAPLFMGSVIFWHVSSVIADGQMKYSIEVRGVNNHQGEYGVRIMNGAEAAEGSAVLKKAVVMVVQNPATVQKLETLQRELDEIRQQADELAGKIGALEQRLDRRKVPRTQTSGHLEVRWGSNLDHSQQPTPA